MSASSDPKPEATHFVSLRQKISVFFIALFLFFAVCLCVFSYRVHRRECIDGMASAAQAFAQMMGTRLDGDRVAREMAGGAGNAYQQDVLALINPVVMETPVKFIYVIMPEPDGRHRFFVASEQDVPLGYRHSERCFPPELRDAIQRRTAVNSSIYDTGCDRHKMGPLISGFAPVRNRNGDMVAILGADIPAAEVYRSTSLFAFHIVLLTALFAGAIVPLVYFYIRRLLGDPIARLSAASEKLADGSMDIPGLPVTNDEIGVLSRNFGKVADSVTLLGRTVARLANPMRMDGDGATEGDGAADVPLSGYYAQVIEGIRQLFSVINRLESLVYIVDPRDHTVVFSNKSMAECYGDLRDPSRPRRHCYEILGDDAGGPCPNCPIPRLLADPAPYPRVGEREYQYPGDGRHFLVRNTLMPWIDGREVMFTESKDVTTLKQFEEALRQALDAAKEASRMKSTFLANMSHEIRTPMNGIIGLAELTLADGHLPEKARDNLTKIRHSAESLLQIVNDVLDIAKVESGKVELESVPFTLRDILALVDTVIAPKAAERGNTLQIAPRPDDLMDRRFEGDPTKLRQVLLNLLSNAAKFTENGTIILEVAQAEADGDGARVHFSIHDTGVGMEADQLQRIFDPFTQADSSITRRYGGTGLGLPLVKGFVELMGGRLAVESRPGLGSTFGFTLRLRAAKDGPLPEADAPGAKTRPVFQGAVLVCEDNAINQEVISQHLLRVGLRPALADNGRVGVDLVADSLGRGEPFDLVLMDVHMPVMDGLEAARRIVELGYQGPIVALTANIMAHDRALYREAGMADFLGKPFNARELWTCLERHLAAIGRVPVADEAASDIDDSAGSAVNRVEGLGRAGGSKAMYGHLLRLFVAEKRDFNGQFDKALAAGDARLAQRLVHTLRGSAAMVGAKRLAAIAGDAEAALARDGAVLPVEVRKRLSEELAAVMEELADYAADDLAPPPALDGEAARRLIERLRAMVEAGQSGYGEMAVEIHGVLRALGWEVELLVEQLEADDFEQALITLDLLGDKLDDASVR